MGRIKVERRAVNVDRHGLEILGGCGREDLIGRPKIALTGDGIVVGSRDLAQAKCQMRIDRWLPRLRHLDLRQNELEIGFVESNHGPHVSPALMRGLLNLTASPIRRLIRAKSMWAHEMAERTNLSKIKSFRSRTMYPANVSS